jgi:hypothetical protein
LLSSSIFSLKYPELSVGPLYIIMTSTPVPPPLAGFRRTGTATYVYEPATTLSEEDEVSKTPDLILIPSWLNAAPKHIAKYTAFYKAFYPNARILLSTTSSADSISRTGWDNEQRIAPILYDLYSQPAECKILMHIFSNGGAIDACLIARQYKAHTGMPLPLSAVVLDSTPGRLHYGRAIAAYEVALPKNPVLHLLGLIGLHLFLWAYYVVYALFRWDDVLTVMFRELNDKSLFPEDAPRLYIYSKEDNMILDEDVEDHAKEAEKKGWSCTLSKFEGTGHVAHMMSDPKRYWAAVKALWDEI